MALTRYGNQAFDWARVYAVRVTGVNFHDQPNKLAIFADLPGAAIDRPTFEISHGPDGEKAWQAVIAEGRLTKFKTDLPIALDMTKVCAIARDSETRIASLTLDLGKNRGGAFELDCNAAYVILETLGEA